MTGHLVINVWAGEWMQQWKEVWSVYKSIAEVCDKADIILLGDHENLPEFIGRLPLEKAIILDEEYYNSETLLHEMAVRGEKDEVYLFSYGSAAHELAVRLAKRLDGSSLTCVESIQMKEGDLWAYKNIYSNNVQGTFCMSKTPYCISVTKAGREEPWNAAEKKLQRITVFGRKVSHIIEYKEELIAREDFLKDAKLVIAIGKGIKTREEVSAVEELADRIGARIVASRPLVMQGLVPMYKMTGASGLIMHPELCIAAGVSGAAAFYAGIEKSHCIVAVNTNPEAFIMKMADVVIQADYKEIFHALKLYIQEEGAEDDTDYGGAV